MTSASGGAPQLLVGDAIFGSLSSDGRRLAFYRPTTGGILLARADGSEAAPYHGKNFPPRLRAATLRFSPDGASLAVLEIPTTSSGSTLDLWAIPVSGGDPVKVAGGLSMFINPRFSWSSGTRGFLLPHTSAENSPIRSRVTYMRWTGKPDASAPSLPGRWTKASRPYRPMGSALPSPC